MKILHLDKNHDSLINELKSSGYINVEAYKMTLANVKSIIHQFDGIVTRSRFKIDTDFLKNGRKHLEEIYLPFLLEVLRCNLGLQEFSLLQELQLLRVTV